MKGLVNIHIHTIYSDGAKTPQQIIKMAKEIGLTTITITNHSMITVPKNITEEEKMNIKVINGVEVSANVSHGRMHILGYKIDIENKNLNEKLTNRLDVKNLMLYIEYLNRLFDIQIS